MSELAKALVQYQKHTKGFEADKQGNRSKYASIGAVISNVKQAAQYGLAFTQEVDFEGQMIFVRTVMLHESGETRESRYPVIVDDVTNNQKIGGAITYAKRYALASMFGTEKGVEDADDDGEINGLLQDAPKEPESEAPLSRPDSGQTAPAEVTSLAGGAVAVPKPEIKKVADKSAAEKFLDKVSGLVDAADSHQAAVMVIEEYVPNIKTLNGLEQMWHRIKPTTDDMIEIFANRKLALMQAEAKKGASNG